jgi:hypothetical protein
MGFVANIEYFNKTNQTGKHQQDVNILQSCIIGTAFIHDYFFWESVGINGLLEKGGSRSFISMFGQHEINDVT